MPDKFDRFDAYLARKQAQQRRRRDTTATPTSLLDPCVQQPTPPQTAQPTSAIDKLAAPSLFTTADSYVHPDVEGEKPIASHDPSAASLVHHQTGDETNTAQTPTPSHMAATASMLATRHDAQWRRDLQILALHQKMLEKLQQQPHRVSEFLDKLEQRKLHGRIRHGEYLFWYCALSQWQHQAQAIASLLSMEPGPRKYRRRTLLAGLLTETERQQILLGHAP